MSASLAFIYGSLLLPPATHLQRTSLKSTIIPQSLAFHTLSLAQHEARMSISAIPLALHCSGLPASQGRALRVGLGKSSL